jgi:hypothetical protein
MRGTVARCGHPPDPRAYACSPEVLEGSVLGRWVFKEHTLWEVAGRDTLRLENAGLRSTAGLDESVAAASSRLCTTEVRGSIPLDTTRIRADLHARTSVQENVRTSARCAAPSVVAP